MRKTSTIVMIARDRSHGWVACFAAENPWGMPEYSPLSLPFGWDAKYDTVAEDIRSRFSDAIVAYS